MVKILRVDPHLIEAQTIQEWCELLSIDNILIMNSEIVKDEMLSMKQKLAVPHGIRVAIKDLSGAIELLFDPVCEALNLLVVVKTTNDALLLLEQFPDIPNVTIGGYCMDIPPDETIHLCSSLLVTKRELADLKKILSINPNSIYQITPWQSPVLLKHLITQHDVDCQTEAISINH